MSADDSTQRLEQLRHRTLRELEYQRRLGRILDDEFSRRTSLARSAASTRDLRPLIADLVIAATAGDTSTTRTSSAPTLSPNAAPIRPGAGRIADRPRIVPAQNARSEPAPLVRRQTVGRHRSDADTDFVLALMSSTVRTGTWHPPETVQALALMGGIKLDFREAVFRAATTHVHAWAIMGGVAIIVPPDVEVIVQGFGLMGHFDHKSAARPPSGAPRLHVDGLALMGGVDVKVRAPAEPIGDD